MLTSMVKEHTAKQTARKEEQGNPYIIKIENIKFHGISPSLRTKTKGSYSIWKWINSCTSWPFKRWVNFLKTFFSLK